MARVGEQAAGKPVPTSLICVHCDKQWEPAHLCDVLYGMSCYVIRG